MGFVNAHSRSKSAALNQAIAQVKTINMIMQPLDTARLISIYSKDYIRKVIASEYNTPPKEPVDYMAITNQLIKEDQG